MYSSTLALTSALDEVGGKSHTPAALPPRKNRYPLYGRLGGPQGRSERVRKISPPSGILFLFHALYFRITTHQMSMLQNYKSLISLWFRAYY